MGMAAGLPSKEAQINYWRKKAMFYKKNYLEVVEIAKELFPSHSIACKQYGASKKCDRCIYEKALKEITGE